MVLRIKNTLAVKSDTSYLPRVIKSVRSTYKRDGRCPWTLCLNSEEDLGSGSKALNSVCDCIFLCRRIIFSYLSIFLAVLCRSYSLLEISVLFTVGKAVVGPSHTLGQMCSGSLLFYFLQSSIAANSEPPR